MFRLGPICYINNYTSTKWSLLGVIIIQNAKKEDSFVKVHDAPLTVRGSFSLAFNFIFLLQQINDFKLVLKSTHRLNKLYFTLKMLKDQHLLKLKQGTILTILD